MQIDVSVPQLPESVSDATVVVWRKKEGEKIKRDESLVDLETDKVVLEVPAPADGVVQKIHQPEGAVVESGQLLASFETPDSGPDFEADSHPGTGEPVVEENAAHNAEALISPSAKKMLEDNQLKAQDITGSGRDGRILKEDVIAYMQQPGKQPEKQAASSEPQVQAALKTPDNASTQPVAQAGVGRAQDDGRIEKRVPMTRLRSRIAERLLEAQHNAAILTTFNEVNMQPVMDLRSKYKALFAEKYAIKLGFMSFFIKATLEALKRFPAVNASIDGDDIVYHGFFDIGVAVASARGLVVPVLRNADQMSFAELESGIADFVDKAKNNKLSLEQMTGGTFSITNGGVFGSMLSTPIINPPQSAILGMHKIQPRAVVENGEILARPMMYLALSYDHRIIDGAEAVQFLLTIKEILEDPARILVGV
ncbi:Dihydrolipoamide succinyltransferase component (E2) of 2-oxoglutarate dehydrogenase complex [hydrothermal vent metagenome]|uniref:dihydrolipoyllysine-residue succinyltransferase n=1 Tax=hydrothermal vent metagenome TaxID=652676 RepID=A0A3B0WZW5_9ZZZZ